MTIAQVESDPGLSYATLWHRFPGTRRRLVMTITDEHLALALGDQAEPERVVMLPLGSGRLAADYFRHLPPTPLALENAIVCVEDEIAKGRALLGSDAELMTSDPVLRELARCAGIGGNQTAVMHRETVEALFSRLASVAEGQPLAYAGLPLDAGFMASLLMLREFMHHLGFDEIRCF